MHAAATAPAPSTGAAAAPVEQHDMGDVDQLGDRRQ